MSGFTRREFIKIGSAGAGALAVGSGLTTKWWGLDSHQVYNPETEGEKIIPTFCEICFWKCGVLAHVKDGKVTKLVGNPQHPLANGRLCPRGVGGTGLLYDPDRIKKPLLRTQKRGEDVFTEVDWKTALDKVGDELTKIKTKYGPEALALYLHGFGGSWFSSLVKAYGSPNIGQPSFAQCRGARDVAYGITYGNPVGSPEAIDILNAKCMTLIGSHLGENMHNTQVQEMADAIANGAQLVVVDPRFSVAAGKAKYWLPIKPGTDIALLLAWMNVIVTENRFDKSYIKNYAVGFDELNNHLADKTPEWAEKITSVKADLIRETARFIASFAPASLIHPGRHSAWYGDDTQRCRAMSILAALLGNYGRKGGYIKFSKMPLPPYPGPKIADPEKPTADKPKGKVYPFPDEVTASGLCQASFPDKADYQIRSWMVYGTNLVQSLPNPKETIEAIQNLDFIVSIDVLPSEICGWSDVVLPECTYLEREDDVFAASYKQPFLAIRQKVVEPMYDSKPGWWIAKELANRLGLGQIFPWDDALSCMEKRIELGGYNWDDLKKNGVILGAKKPTCEEDGLELKFGTESGKIELYSEAVNKAGHDPLPNYTPIEEVPQGSFRLLNGRAPVHTFGRTTNNKILLESFPENEVWVNAEAAKSIFIEGFPLKNGDKVILINQDGVKSLPIKVKITEKIRPDCVYMVHGFGHTSKGLSLAKNNGAADSDLTTRYKVDPLMGGTGMNLNYVKFEKAGV